MINRNIGFILTYDQEEEISYGKKKVIVKPVWKWLIESNWSVKIVYTWFELTDAAGNQATSKIKELKFG